MLARPKENDSAEDFGSEARWGMLRPIERAILLAAHAQESRGGQLRLEGPWTPRQLAELGYLLSAQRGGRSYIALTPEGSALVRSCRTRGVGQILRTQAMESWLCPVCGAQQAPPEVPAGTTVTGVPCRNCGCSFRLTPKTSWTAEFLSVDVNPREVDS